MNDCLKAMTTAHAGACVLLTEDRKLAGIFTHGDFVRAYGRTLSSESSPSADS
ncbi:MAG: hypothetical protein ACLSUW_04460 [Akkermansia sp.]